jgi:DNA (cytosine-5)-methyltransferase 1
MMSHAARPRLLDLFCGAGGSAVGYNRAGFDVVGVDSAPQPRFPFAFVQADALEYLAAHGHEFDAIHASPPCQAHVLGFAAVNRNRGRELRHLDLISVTREALMDLGLPYVIENVEGAPLRFAFRLCGSSFGLAVRRHRRFESSVLLLAPDCCHEIQRDKKYPTNWRPNGRKVLASVVQVYGTGAERMDLWGPAMGINWMTGTELRQAIPPAYTEFIGKQLLRALAASAIEGGEP